MQLKYMALVLAFVSTNAYAQEDKSEKPKEEAAKEKLPPKPALRTWTVKSEGHAFTFEFKPGIPTPGQVVEVIVNVAKIPDRPHPRFGNRIPVNKARLIVEVVNPAGESVGRYLTHAIPFSAGKYGFHVTPTQQGLYEMNAKLTARKLDGALTASLKMPVDVWPLPSKLQGSGDSSGGRGSRRPVVRKR